MWDEEAYLIGYIEGPDDAGDCTTVDKKEERVFVNEVSITQNEFYQAHASGFKAEIKLEMHKFEYKNQMKARFKGVTYDVIRTYSNGEILELTLGCESNGSS